MNFTNIQKRINTYPSQTTPEIEEGGSLSSLFCEASIILIAKPDKNITRKKITDHILMNIYAKKLIKKKKKLQNTQENNKLWANKGIKFW